MTGGGSFYLMCIQRATRSMIGDGTATGTTRGDVEGARLFFKKEERKGEEVVVVMVVVVVVETGGVG